MKDLFIPYKQALAMKELGFDDEVLKVYDIDSSESELFNYGEVLTGDDELYAPLYQQAFKWFREKHKLHGNIYYFDNEEVADAPYSISLEGITIEQAEMLGEGENYTTYEEAELACLNKLIEIVKK